MGNDAYRRLKRLERLECFSVAESEDMVRVLDTLREHFTKRSPIPEIGFWTLGTSSYLDLTAAHGDAAQKTNDIIASSFDEFYLKIFEVLQDYLGEPVISPSSVNVPGFHIFEKLNSLPIGVPYGGNIHRDTAHMSLPFPDVDPISFTIMLEAPKNGAGLNYWEDDIITNIISSTPIAIGNFGSVDVELQERLIETVKTFKYNIGELLLFDGQTVHQIANMVATDENDRRISIQGHGVLTDDGYVVYF